MNNRTRVPTHPMTSTQRKIYELEMKKHRDQQQRIQTALAYLKQTSSQSSSSSNFRICERCGV
jgi:hypothetical protein